MSLPSGSLFKRAPFVLLFPPLASRGALTPRPWITWAKAHAPDSPNEANPEHFIFGADLDIPPKGRELTEAIEDLFRFCSLKGVANRPLSRIAWFFWADHLSEVHWNKLLKLVEEQAPHVSLRFVFNQEMQLLPTIKGRGAWLRPHLKDWPAASGPSFKELVKDFDLGQKPEQWNSVLAYRPQKIQRLLEAFSLEVSPLKARAQESFLALCRSFDQQKLYNNSMRDVIYRLWWYDQQKH